jgi:hypothetical protein
LVPGSILWEGKPLILLLRSLSIVVLFSAAVATFPAPPSEGVEARAGGGAPAGSAFAAALNELHDVTNRLAGRGAPPASRPRLPAMCAPSPRAVISSWRR